MTQLSENYVRELLSGISDPHVDADLVNLGWVRGIGIDGQRVSVDLRAGYPLDGIREHLIEDITARLEADEQIEKAVVNLDWKVFAHKVQGDLKPLEQIRNIAADRTDIVKRMSASLEEIRNSHDTRRPESS